LRNRSDEPDDRAPADPPLGSGATETDDLDRALTPARRARARALDRARAAEKWDVVWLLNNELEARRTR